MTELKMPKTAIGNKCKNGLKCMSAKPIPTKQQITICKVVLVRTFSLFTTIKPTGITNSNVSYNGATTTARKTKVAAESSPALGPPTTCG